MVDFTAGFAILWYLLELGIMLRGIEIVLNIQNFKNIIKFA